MNINWNTIPYTLILGSTNFGRLCCIKTNNDILQNKKQYYDVQMTFYDEVVKGPLKLFILSNQILMKSSADDKCN